LVVSRRNGWPGCERYWNANLDSGFVPGAVTAVARHGEVHIEATGSLAFGAGTALFMAVAYRPATDPAVARAFWDAGWLAYNSAGFAFVAWIAIVVVAVLRHRALPPWTAWIGVPVALINLAGPFAMSAGTGAFSPQGWFALVVGLTFGLWLLAISLAVWQATRPPARSVNCRQPEPYAGWARPAWPVQH
jgi:hypothetical protein